MPLYSALYESLSHPSVLRAVFIDSKAFEASDFIANFVVLTLRLRNSSLSDQAITAHLSEALAGSLTGVGHSKIYEEQSIYT